MKYLQPMFLREKYFDPIEREIQRIFYETIYLPLFKVLRVQEVQNSKMALYEAIKQGAVWYEGGAFRGQFNAKISAELKKLGAVYKHKKWILEEVPTDLRIAQATADENAENMRRDMLAVLDNMDFTSVYEVSNLENKYDRTLGEMSEDFIETIPATTAISIPAVLTADQRKVIAVDWANNLDLYIKGWAEENIIKLREEIQNPILSGRRAESFHALLQENYGVSKRKAKFLARQETALLMSKFQETSCRNIGIEKYKWLGAMDARERPDHKALEGKIFTYDDPPVTDKRTGARNNPGEDFGCRCVAMPMIV